MNFYVQQERARRQTRTLVFLFVVVVALLMAAFYGVVLGAFHFMPFTLVDLSNQPLRPSHTLEAGLTSLAMLGVILGGSLWRMHELRAGGVAVADMVGARILPPSSTVPRERRLLNVVEEMALASGLAVPQVAVLDDEDGINAFAAGFGPGDAVVTVSMGALTRLTRDELQGVVAHEFAHLQNGDMRLNLRMIGLLHGLMLINLMGRMLTESATRVNPHRKDRKSGLSLFALGIGVLLRILGYLGVLAARLIRAGVSRQREYLADAFAVQFTRNVEGLGGALRKIGGFAARGGSGSNIRHLQAETLSHLFLAGIGARVRHGWFATHPPLHDRLARLYGRSVIAWRDAPVLEEDRAPLPDQDGSASGSLEAVSTIAWVSPFDTSAGNDPLRPEHAASATRDASAAGSQGALQGALPGAPQAGSPAAPAPVPLPAILIHAARDASDAPALVRALVQAPAAVPAPLASALQTLPPGARLPLIDLAMPTLRALSDAQRTTLLAEVGRLIRADGRVSLFEWIIETVLTHRLQPGSARPPAPRQFDEATLRTHFTALLQLVASVAGAAVDEARGARETPGTSAADPAGAAGAAPAVSRASRLAWDTGAAALVRDGLLTQAPDAPASLRPDLRAVQAALDAFIRLAPLKKPLVLRALDAAIHAHGAPAPAALEILRALGAALDVPLPASVTGMR